MHIYSHTFLVEASAMMEWLDFTTQVLYKDLQNSENYSKFTYSKVNHDTEDAFNFNLQIQLEDLEKLNNYETKDLPQLQQKIVHRFGEKVFFFTTHLEVIARL